MKALISLAAAAVLFTVGTNVCSRADWNGQISDSLCGAKQRVRVHRRGQRKISDQECTLACVKGGSKYVLSRAARCTRSRIRRMPIWQSTPVTRSS